MVKSLKAFRDYVLRSNIISYVLGNIIKDILIHLHSEWRRGKWISKIQKYDLEINPTKLIKGQGLAKLLENSNFQALDMNMIGEILAGEGEFQNFHFISFLNFLTPNGIRILCIIYKIFFPSIFL